MASATPAVKADRSPWLRGGTRLPATTLATLLTTAAIGLAGCGGSSTHAGSPAASQSSTRTSEAKHSSPATVPPPRNASEAPSRSHQAQRPRASAGAARSFKAAATPICEALGRSLGGQSSPGSPAQSSRETSALAKAQQDAFATEQAIQRLSRLSPPRPARGAFDTLIFALRRLQALQLAHASASSPRTSAATKTSAAARARLTIAATAAGLPACAHLQTSEAPSAQMPGRSTEPPRGRTQPPGRP